MGKAWLKWKFQSMGLKHCKRHEKNLIRESYRRFTIRTERRFDAYADMDYYGLNHTEELCSENQFSNRCEGDEMHKKVHKDTFLLNFFEEYKKGLPGYFGRLVKLFESKDKQKQVNNNVIEGNDLEI